MADSPVNVGTILDDLDRDVVILNEQKEAAWNFRERRHSDWNETYMYHRSKVITNRLTQRQTVNLPILKTDIKTLIKDIDDAPHIYFKNLDNDDQKEVFFNERWNWDGRQNKIKIRDIVDKRQALLFGRTFKKLNLSHGTFKFEVCDPQDILVDRFVDPADLDSARYMAHIHIYRSLGQLLANDFYNKSELIKLANYMKSQRGLLKSEQNAREQLDKSARMQELGQLDVTDPILGESVVELTEHYYYRKDLNSKKEVLWLYVVAEDSYKLADAPLHLVIGETKDDFWHNHLTFSSWGDDVERTDFWSDGVGDILRPINQVGNILYSQIIENRTLINFGMNYYDATKSQDFVPQTFTPEAGGYYPVPGNPNEVMMPVKIADIGETLTYIDFLMKLAEKASAATAAQQGAVEQTKVTLGEIQLALANAKERVKSMSVFYNESWEDLGLKYVKMLEAAPDLIDEVELFKKGRNSSKYYSRIVAPQDWYSKKGYTIEVRDANQDVSKSLEDIQKLNAAKSAMPSNQPLISIYNKHMLEFAGLNASEVKEVMDYDKQNPALMPGQMPPNQQLPQGNQPQLMAGA